MKCLSAFLVSLFCAGAAFAAHRTIEDRVGTLEAIHGVNLHAPSVVAPACAVDGDSSVSCPITATDEDGDALTL